VVVPGFPWNLCTKLTETLRQIKTSFPLHFLWTVRTVRFEYLNRTSCCISLLGEVILAVGAVLKKVSHTLTTHMAPPRINFCLGPAGYLRQFGTDLRQKKKVGLKAAAHEPEEKTYTTVNDRTSGERGGRTPSQFFFPSKISKTTSARRTRTCTAEIVLMFGEKNRSSFLLF